MTRGRRVVVAVVGSAAAGLVVFAVLVSRAVTVEHAEAPEASQRFSAARASLRDATPLLALDDTGKVVRRTDPPAGSPVRITRLAVLAYQAEERRLVSASVPFWFLKLKGPAAQMALRGTGLDLEYLGLAAGDLERYGPALVIDHTRPSGDRLLVWTQ